MARERHSPFDNQAGDHGSSTVGFTYGSREHRIDFSLGQVEPQSHPSESWRRRLYAGALGLIASAAVIASLPSSLSSEHAAPEPTAAGHTLSLDGISVPPGAIQLQPVEGNQTISLKELCSFIPKPLRDSPYDVIPCK